VKTYNGVTIHAARRMEDGDREPCIPVFYYYSGRKNGQSKAWNICVRCTRKSTKCVALINVRRSFKTKAVNARKLAHEKFPELLLPAGADSAP
jgi:hypothetical protein